MTRPDHWTRCSAWIDAALTEAGGTHDLADVKAMIDRGEAQFWPGVNAALVSCIEEFPKRTVLQLWLAGGDRAELTNDLRPRAEAWGVEQGCDTAWIIGRDGWRRALRAHGYRAVSTLISKDLT